MRVSRFNCICDVPLWKKYINHPNGDERTDAITSKRRKIRKKIQ